MKLKIAKNKFYDALQIVARAIAPNSPIPSLSGIKLEVRSDGLTLTGSDSDITIQMHLSNTKDSDLQLTVIEEGDIVIDSRYLIEIVRKIDSTELSIEVIDGTLIRISAGKAEFKLNGFRLEEYPLIDLSVPMTKFSIQSSELSRMIEETSYAANSKETRLVLTGVNLKQTGNSIICTATDSYRLAKKTLNISSDPFNITILARSLNHVKSVFGESDNEIEISLNDKKAQFKTNDILLQTRLLDGSFPDTDRLIPTEFSSTLRINRRALMSAIDRSSFIKTDNMTVIHLVVNSKDDITISNKSQEIGESHEELIAESFEGEPIDISFSGSYMIEAARSLSSEIIKIEFKGAMKPFILRNENGDSSILQLVLPVRTYN